MGQSGDPVKIRSLMTSFSIQPLDQFETASFGITPSGLLSVQDKIESIVESVRQLRFPGSSLS